MRTGWSITFTLLAVALAACTQGAGGSERQDPVSIPGAAGDLLVLETGTGIAAIDAATGSAIVEAAGATPAPDASEIFTTSTGGGDTLLEALDPATGSTMTAAELPGELAVRVVSPSGASIALMEPLAPGADPWIPEGRTSTRLVIADLGGSGDVGRYRLEGNFEPEVFSTDGGSLFMLEYLPPEDPVAYQVVRFDVDRGKVSPVYTRLKGVTTERMAGTRLMQVSSPDGSRLYTLYTTRPPAYAEQPAYAPEPVAFVHILDLRDGWAHCANIPRVFAGGSIVAKALASSPDGDRLFVVDASRGVVSVMNARRLRVIETASVDLGSFGGGPTSALMSADGARLFVARGSAVAVIDAATLAVGSSWSLPAPAVDLGLSADGARLYAATDDAIAVLDAETGESLGELPAAGVRDIERILAA